MNLFFIDGHKKGEKYEISPPGISIGRELDNDIILELEGASRYHAKLEWKDSSWYIKDLGSTNGTKLNSDPITPNTEIQLKEQDEIRIGKQTMLFAEILSESKIEAPPIIKPPETSDDFEIENSAVTVSNMEPTDRSIDKKIKEGLKGKSAGKSLFSFFDQTEAPSESKPAEDEKIDFFTKQSTVEDASPQSSHKHAGLLFYVAVFGAAIILISVYLMFEQTTEKTLPAATKKVTKGAPLLLRYTKQITSSQPKHNIFRYLMEIKDGTITITRDDLQAGLKDQPSRKIGPEKLLELEEQLQEIDFMSAKQGQAGIPRDGEDSLLQLTIAYGKEMNNIIIQNTSPPRSFEEAVRILEDFSENVLDIPAVSLTPEELKEDGLNAFRKGKLLFENYHAQDENLFQAIKYFKVAIENLGAFQPEPPEFNEAYKMKQEATRILQNQIHAHWRNANKYLRLEQFLQAKEEFQSIIGKTKPGSQPYNKARKKIIAIEEKTRRRKR